jgi:hypothetical protein
MYLRNRTRLREHCRVQQDRDTGPVTVVEAQQRLHRLMVHTAAREEGTLSVAEAQQRVSRLKLIFYTMPAEVVQFQ